MDFKGFCPGSSEMPPPPAPMLLTHMTVGGGPEFFQRRELAALLLKARKAAGLTQRQAGAKVGVDPSALSRWERGESLPSGTNVEKMAVVYRLNELELQRAVNRANVEKITESNRAQAKAEQDLADANDGYRRLHAMIVEATETQMAMFNEMRSLFVELSRRFEETP